MKIKDLLKATDGCDELMKNLPMGYESDVDEDEDGEETVVWKDPETGEEREYKGDDAQYTFVHTKDGSFSVPVGEVKRYKELNKK